MRIWCTARDTMGAPRVLHRQPGLVRRARRQLDEGATHRQASARAVPRACRKEARRRQHVGLLRREPHRRHQPPAQLDTRRHCQASPTAWPAAVASAGVVAPQRNMYEPAVGRSTSHHTPATDKQFKTHTNNTNKHTQTNSRAGGGGATRPTARTAGERRRALRDPPSSTGHLRDFFSTFGSTMCALALKQVA